MQSSDHNTVNQRVRPARALLFALWLITIVAVLFSVPSAFSATQADWQFNESVLTLGNGLSYETLTAVITAVRLALAGIYLLTAGVFLALRPSAGSLLVALTLLGLPFSFGLVGVAESTFPQPLGALLDGFAYFLNLIGLAGSILLLLLFPDGHFFPAQFRLPALAGLVLTGVGIIAVEFVEDAWALFFIAFLGVLLLGIVGQVLRFRAAGPVRRRQTGVFLIAVLALPVLALTDMFRSLPLLNLIVQYAVLALIPVGLLIAAGRGLWGKPPSPRMIPKATAALIVVICLATAAIAAAWWRANQPQPVDVAALVPAAGPVPVILDTDMAMDDIPALLYLLQHPGVDVRAITVNGVAFAHCNGGVRNALGLLEVARAPVVPVACGREQPFPGGTPAPHDWRASADKLYGAQVRTGDRTADARPAAELLADTVSAAPGEIVIVALGPLTNLADAFQSDPALAGRIREIVIMGGAMDVPGNVTDGDSANQTAEWNFFADPVAADITLAAGAPVTLVPLDATNDVPFTHGFYQRLRANPHTRPAVFTSNLIYLNQGWLVGGMYWWDSLAAVAALDDSVATWQDMKLDVVTEPGPEMGRSVESVNGAPVRVAVAADRRRFETLFLAVLNHE